MTRRAAGGGAPTRISIFLSRPSVTADAYDAATRPRAGRPVGRCPCVRRQRGYEPCRPELPAPASAAPPPAADAAVRDVPDVLAALDSSPDGISREEAASRRARDGLNEIAGKAAPGGTPTAAAFHTPFNYLLLALAAVAFVTEDYKAAAVISAMVGVSGGLRFWQEYRSGSPPRSCGPSSTPPPPSAGPAPARGAGGSGGCGKWYRVFQTQKSDP